jgi:predicted nucleic acid-binding protein
MGAYLIDTNIIAKYLTGELISEASRNLVTEVIMQKPIISIVNKIELLSWTAAAEVEQKVGEFISLSEVLNISDEIALLSAQLRRKFRKLKTPDAIIAATAIHHKLVLLTANERDFANIKGLKLINPAKMV